MNKDKVEKIRNSLVQHGKMNDRIYLMKLDERDVPEILEDLSRLAEEKKYTKIFAKVPKTVEEVFLEEGYGEEAVIPDFYNGKIDCAFLGKFLSDERKNDQKAFQIEAVLGAAKSKACPGGIDVTKKIDDTFDIHRAGPDDVVSMSRIYKEVFRSYPFPIQDPQYLLDTMKSHIDYFVACCSRGQMVAVSSSEKDPDAKNSEMTDFATVPEYRGKGLACKLLRHMDATMSKEGFKTAYTIARSLSYGMNITFARNGYVFAGTLVNNTNISGSIESMNVWYKSLAA